MKPRKRLKLIFWDSCIFFAWIKDEPWPDEIKKGIEQTLEQAYSNQLAIVTSSVTLAEVIQSQLTKEQKERYARIFQHPNLQLYDIDRRIAGKAGVIREAYDTRVFNDKMQQVSGSFMSLGDSLQLATALHLGVREFQTLDGAGKKKPLSLLSLNGNVAGAMIAIVKPCYVKPPELLVGPPPADMKGGQTSLLDMLEKEVTEGQPQAISAATADSGTDAPPSPTPDPVVKAEPEQSAIGGVEPKLGQQVPPPSAIVIPPIETKAPAREKPAGAESGS